MGYLNENGPVTQTPPLVRPDVSDAYRDDAEHYGDLEAWGRNSQAAGDVCGSYAPDERRPRPARTVGEIEDEIRAKAGLPPVASKGINPKDLLGALKAPLGLVPMTAFVQVAEVMGLGARKYGPYNWRDKAVQSMVYYEAALRHLAAWVDGQSIDPESGQSHLAHVAACMLILLDAEKVDALVDTRPPAGVAAELMAAR